jgi:hypothetical protein
MRTMDHPIDFFEFALIYKTKVQGFRVSRFQSSKATRLQVVLTLKP